MTQSSSKLRGTSRATSSTVLPLRTYENMEPECGIAGAMVRGKAPAVQPQSRSHSTTRNQTKEAKSHMGLKGGPAAQWMCRGRVCGQVSECGSGEVAPRPLQLRLWLFLPVQTPASPGSHTRRSGNTSPASKRTQPQAGFPSSLERLCQRYWLLIIVLPRTFTWRCRESPRGQSWCVGSWVSHT